jgi:molybdopterin-guanine dinucleotide biosynthesis protein A
VGGAFRFPSISGAILAGGKATRLGGGEKALLRLGGIPLLERVAEALRPLFPELLVVTPRPDSLGETAEGLVPVRDIHEGAGPLGGIHAAMGACTKTRLFVVSCDLPFLDPAVVSVVAEHAGEADLVLPRVGGRTHVLHALYERSLREQADRLLLAGERRVRGLAAPDRTLCLEEGDFACVPGFERSFLNINSAEDLERAREMLGDAG